MSTEPDRVDDFSEPCDACGRETPHSVYIEVRSASPNPSSWVHAREPIRVATCRVCGDQSVLRMSKQ